MKLIQPIIDRTLADVKNRTAKGYFNAADWKRVYQNAQLLHILLGLIAYPARFYELPEPTITDLPTAERLNTLLGNIQRIREASALPAACGITDIKTDWKAGASSAAPNYADANAWEALEKILAESILTAAKDKVYCGVANAGQSRVRQRNFRPMQFVEAAEMPVRMARMGNAQTGTGLTRQNYFRRHDLFKDITDYDLYDQFIMPLAAGSVNGTLAEFVGGVRTVTGSSARISINDYALKFAAGGVAGDRVTYPPITRAAGKRVSLRVKITANSARFGLTRLLNGFYAQTPTTLNVSINSDILIIQPITAGIEYEYTMVLRSSGTAFFIKGGEFATPTLIYVSPIRSAATETPTVEANDANSAFEVRRFRAPKKLAVIAPIASDSMNRADGAMGFTDGAGAPETGGGALAWTADVGAFGIVSNKAKASSLNGGVAVATVTATTPHMWAEVAVTRAGGDAGLALRWVDANNHVKVVRDGANIRLVKVVGGTQTTLINTAATYYAGVALRVLAAGDKFRVVYNNIAIGSWVTISDTVLQTSGKVGLYTSDLGNTFDNFVVWARDGYAL